ncbi:hypothetical protein BU23DRAFT_585750 [Bimuria novae-zelandiae CBS 107.79]|uniref:Uncharacterized protein n=1 Tax=Bimuria novae-zelandiae CBS 107.79 TaxID=1447943 RepID=A0A6A5UHH1_9PLEO|nr:hypothetical protein BU23DRAFT_585750 [Bimuria novae-zelandiae CBS 107.79]
MGLASIPRDLEYGLSKRQEAASRWAKYTIKYLMGDYPYLVALESVNTSLWDVPILIDVDEMHAITWVTKIIRDYNIKELFYKVNRNTLKSLKMVLRHREVYTGNNRARLTNSLYNLSTLKNTPEWDPVEFKAIIFDQRLRAYKRQQNAKQTPLMAKQ